MGWKGESRRHGLSKKGIRTSGKKRKIQIKHIFKSSGNYKKVLDSDEMLTFILDNGLENWEGEIDFNSAKEIAGSSDKWELKEIPLDTFDWIVKPRKKSKNQLPPIILEFNDGEYEVLDGKHRVGEHKFRGDKTILAYVGKEWEELMASAIFERGVREGDPPLKAVHGEAGHGIYAFKPNSEMRSYYTQQGESLYTFDIPDNKIADLTKELDQLIPFMKKDIDKTAEQMGGFYVKPKINRENYQRFGRIIEDYIRVHHPDKSAYLVQHKGIGIPTGKQLVITNMDDVEIIS